MKKYFAILIASITLLFSSASHAIHGNVYYENNIQYCSDLCASIDTLENGSRIFFNGQLDVFGGEVLTTLDSYLFEFTSTSIEKFYGPGNMPLISSNIFTSTDEFEKTTILGGTAQFDTSFAFLSLLGTPSELILDFDNDRIDLYVTAFTPTGTSRELLASTSPVPVPGALILFLSGLLGLVPVSIARHKAA
ncbi:MAG TPA: hypothetical protein ENJ28_06480 [Gammaproteobacteria bacterium]|nr:hypothetical protein [Gammaproteobacteria bacterium]